VATTNHNDGKADGHEIAQLRSFTQTDHSAWALSSSSRVISRQRYAKGHVLFFALLLEKLMPGLLRMVRHARDFVGVLVHIHDQEIEVSECFYLGP
jgi:hypothetical protein